MNNVAESDYVLTYPEWRTARYIVRCVREAFKDPATRSEFEQWYLEKYGKPYEWQYESVEVTYGQR